MAKENYKYKLNTRNKIMLKSYQHLNPIVLKCNKHLNNIIITPLYKCEEKAEKITGIKSYKESTQRMIDANGGL